MQMIYASKNKQTGLYSINQVQIRDGNRYFSTLKSDVKWKDIRRELTTETQRIYGERKTILAPTGFYGIGSSYGVGVVVEDVA